MTRAELAAVARWLKDAAAGTVRDPATVRVLARLFLSPLDTYAYRLLSKLHFELMSNDEPRRKRARRMCSHLAEYPRQGLRLAMIHIWDGVELESGLHFANIWAVIDNAPKALNQQSKYTRSRNLVGAIPGWQQWIDQEAATGKWHKWRGAGGLAAHAAKQFKKSERTILRRCKNPLNRGAR